MTSETTGVEVVIARVGADAYRVTFRGQHSDNVSQKEVEAQFPGLPEIAIAHELTAIWMISDA